jgi:hypothetical protein
MQTALSQAMEVVKKAQKSLKLAETELNIAGAIDKVQKEIVNARALLKLQESTSLQQGIEEVVQQLPKKLSRTSGNFSSLSLVSPDLIHTTCLSCPSSFINPCALASPTMSVRPTRRLPTTLLTPTRLLSNRAHQRSGGGRRLLSVLSEYHCACRWNCAVA